MANENFGYKEESSYQHEGNSIKEIILRHIRKISDIMTKELTGSWWEKKPIRTQSGTIFTEIYHEDLREAYCNAIDFLVDLLEPNGDSELKKYLEENNNLEKDWNKDEEGNDEEDDGKIMKKKILNKRKIFREINKMFQRTNFWKSNDNTNEGNEEEEGE